MEGLVLKYNDLSKALKNIHTALNSYKHPSIFSQDDHKAILLESLVKRFELLYELFWKYSQMIVRDVHGLVAQATSPNKVFRLLYTVQLIDADELKVLLDGVALRNQFVHRYGEKMAQAIAENVEPFILLVTSLASRLAPEKVTEES